MGPPDDISVDNVDNVDNNTQAAMAEREIVLRNLREFAGNNLDLVEKQRLNLTSIISIITLLTGIAFILLEIYIKDSKVPVIVGKSVTGAGILTSLVTGIKSFFDMSSKKKDVHSVRPVFLPEINRDMVELSLKIWDEKSEKDEKKLQNVEK